MENIKENLVLSVSCCPSVAAWFDTCNDIQVSIEVLHYCIGNLHYFVNIQAFADPRHRQGLERRIDYFKL